MAFHDRRHGPRGSTLEAPADSETLPRSKFRAAVGLRSFLRRCLNGSDRENDRYSGVEQELSEGTCNDDEVCRLVKKQSNGRIKFQRDFRCRKLFSVLTFPPRRLYSLPEQEMETCLFLHGCVVHAKVLRFRPDERRRSKLVSSHCRRSLPRFRSWLRQLWMACIVRTPARILNRLLLWKQPQKRLRPRQVEGGREYIIHPLPASRKPNQASWLVVGMHEDAEGDSKQQATTEPLAFTSS